MNDRIFLNNKNIIFNCPFRKLDYKKLNLFKIINLIKILYYLKKIIKYKNL